MQEFLLVSALRQGKQRHPANVHRHFPVLCQQKALVHHAQFLHRCLTHVLCVN